MWFRDNLIAHRGYLEREKERIGNQLRTLPKEKLIRKKAHGKTYYYIEKKGKRISLLNEEKLKNQYLFKEQLETQLNAIRKNLPLLNKFISGYRTLEVIGMRWKDIESEQNTVYPEERKHVYQGIYFRSKSEMLIAMMLTSFGIEFKYESRLYVNGRYIYPDFIIKRPKDGKIIVWEHFGRMDLEEYRLKNYKRLEEYHLQGFDLWDNLIVSFDQGNQSLNMDHVEKIVKLYLL